MLASWLDSSQFRLPVEECRAHGDYCLLYREDLGEESDDDEEEVKAKEEEEKGNERNKTDEEKEKQERKRERESKRT